MARFNFNLRTPSSDRPTAIHLIIRYTNHRIVFSTGEHILSKFWETNQRKRGFQRAKSTMPGSPEFNHRLEVIEQKARQVFQTWLTEHQEVPPTPKELHDALAETFKRRTEATSNQGLFEYIAHYIANSGARTNPKTGRPMAPRTIAKYKTTLLHLKSFSKASKTPLHWAMIDSNFYNSWVEWLQKEHDMSTNTIGKHIQTLKTFLNAATEDGVNENAKFRSSRFHTISEDSDSIYLNEEELKEIEQLVLREDPRLDRVRDLFLIGCWTGLRFSDYHQVSVQNIDGGMLRIRQSKTDQTVVIPVGKTVLNILEKHGGQLPSSLSNQKFNEYLKEVCRLCPILSPTVSLRITKGGRKTVRIIPKAEAVSTHTARRSFASNLYRQGIPSITIMAITGHRSERQFLKYIKLDAEEHARILQGRMSVV